MIVRQSCARHGRSAFSQSSRIRLNRSYVFEANNSPSASLSTRAANSAQQITEQSSGTSATLETPGKTPASATKSLEDAINSLISSNQSIEQSLNAHIAARILTPLTNPSSSSDSEKPLEVGELNGRLNSTLPQAPFPSLRAFNRHRSHVKTSRSAGSSQTSVYSPHQILQSPPTASELTLPMLLAHQTHLGHHTSLWHPSNSGYIFGIRDSIHIISLDVTFAYLRRAASVVSEIARRGGIILFVGTRKNFSDIVVHSAKLAGGYHIFGRWTPGSLTNGQQILNNCAIKVVDILDRPMPEYDKLLQPGSYPVLKPDLVICLNPIENEVCLHECGLHNVPTIGIIDTDANPSWVTYPIPANDDSARSVALIAGVLGRAGEAGQLARRKEALQGRATYELKQTKVMLDMMEEVRDLEVSNEDASGEEDGKRGRKPQK